MVLNIIGLSEEKDCDQKILNLVRFDPKMKNIHAFNGIESPF